MAAPLNEQKQDHMHREELKLDVADFELKDKIGDGSFSEVYKATLHKRMSAQHPMHKYGTYFACKLIDKRAITINRQSAQFIGAVMREKRALYECGNAQFILQLYATAKTTGHGGKIAFVTQLCDNGDLLDCVNKTGAFSLDAVRYYGACMVSALQYMRGKGIIHRDIKPENIMLNAQNQPILSDFGCVKLLPPKFERESMKSDPDFVGTPQFMAPELITIPKSLLMKTPEQLLGGDPSDNDAEQEEENVEQDKQENAEWYNADDGRLKDEYYKCLDLWSLACFLYQLRTTQLLFKGDTDFLVFREVKTMNYSLDAIKNESFKDLLINLLKEEPMQRLGAHNLGDLKKHSFFNGVDWDNLNNMKAPAFNKKHEQ